MKITAPVGYEVAVLGIPRRLSRIAFDALKAVPRFTTVLSELRDAVKYLERLATFAAQELPEVVYQLERIREQLAAIEGKLGMNAENGQAAKTVKVAKSKPVKAVKPGKPPADRDDRRISRDERRSGSRRPS